MADQHEAGEVTVIQNPIEAGLPDELVEELHRLRRENAALRHEITRQNRPKSEPATPDEVLLQLPPSSITQPLNPLPLRAANLTELEAQASIGVPKYNRDPEGVSKWIMHLGLGGFSRSHLAMLMDELLVLQEEDSLLGPDSVLPTFPRWGICGVGLMPWDSKLRDALAPQDYLYTLLTRDSIAGDSVRVIGSIMDYVFIPEDPKVGLERLAHPSTAIVSLTVTEKGYCLDSAGNLDLNNALIKHDLAPGGLDSPQSAPGVIIAALRLRRARGVPPFIVLSCDNLPMNGSLARKTAVSMAAIVDPALAEWIASPAVCFPSSMVDRITPVTKQAEIDLLQKQYGIIDNWPVVAEPFVQWVVEDFNADSRPPWEHCGGVQFVPDVKPYELMKLRLLNSSHSALAGVGYLSGYEYVHDAMGDPLVRSFIARYMASVEPTVPPVPGVNLSEYQATLVRRFSNARIADTLLRLAQDSSAKWRSTLALGGLAHSALGAMQFAAGDFSSDPPLFTKYVRNAEDLAKIQTWRRDHMRWRKHGSRGARGEFGANVSLLDVARVSEPPPQDIALALAAWIRFMTGVDEAGKPIKIEDPMAAVLQPLAIKAASPTGSSSSLQKFLTLALGESASSWPQLTQAVERWLTAIKVRGMTCALAEVLSESSSLAAASAGAHGGGADLAISSGPASAHGRLALLKLRHQRLEAELKEVNAQVVVACVEAHAEEEEMAKAVHGGMRRVRSGNKVLNLSASDFTQLAECGSIGSDLCMTRQVTPGL